MQGCMNWCIVLTQPHLMSYLCPKQAKMDEIRQWLDNGKNYDIGVALLAKLHPNKFFVSHFVNGSPKRHTEKLEYELRKSLKNKPTPILPKTVITKLQIEIPDTILRTKNAVYELFTKISTMHRNLYELGESNTEQVVTARKRILDDRAPLIRRYEQIYLLKEKYFDTGKVPSELVSLIDAEVQEEPTTGSPSPRSAFAELSDIELVKKEHALKVAIGKQKNKLQYQSLKKLEQPNPMPEGLVRTKIEQKLAELRKEYSEVTKLLEERK